MSTRWTYKVVTLKAGLFGIKPDAIEEQLNQLGSQGWEMVAVHMVGTTATVYLKKEK
jgi:hypothetical protein